MTRDIDLIVALVESDVDLLRAGFEPDYYVPDELADALAAPGMFNLVHLQSVTKNRHHRAQEHAVPAS